MSRCGHGSDEMTRIDVPDEDCRRHGSVYDLAGAYDIVYRDAAARGGVSGCRHEVAVATGSPLLTGSAAADRTRLPADVDLAWAQQEVKRRHSSLPASTRRSRSSATSPPEPPRRPCWRSSRRNGRSAGHRAAARRCRCGGRHSGRADPRFRHRPRPRHVERRARGRDGLQREQWLERGLTPPDATLLGQAFLDPCHPRSSGLAATASRRAQPATCRALADQVGGCRASEAQLPAWLDAAATRPRVYLTLGTDVATATDEILRRTRRGDRRSRRGRAAAVGSTGDPAMLGELPDMRRTASSSTTRPTSFAGSI